MRVLAGLLLLITVLSGCANIEPHDEPVASIAVADPLRPGLLEFDLLPFDLGQHVVEGSGNARYLVHVHGEATIPEGDGPFPLVILMHGRHGTCAVSGSELLLQPCPDAGPMEPVRSFQGYRYLAEHLASHGMAVLSVDANNVNDHDNTWGISSQASGGDYGATARARILFQVMDAVADGSIGSFATRIDERNVGLMGHSRGGEGVIRAMHMHQQDRQEYGAYGLRAVMALAPTDFARWELEGGLRDDTGRASGPAFATMLPYCDGDVSNLQGVWAYDDMEGGDKHQFLHMGANHNYYNTVWTNTDFGNRGDPYCDEDGDESGRLSPDEQREEGLAIMAAFFRTYLQHDRSLRPLTTGEANLPGDVPVRYHSRFDSRTVFGTGPGLDGIRQGELSVDWCRQSDCPGQNTYGTGLQTVLTWEGEGAIYTDRAVEPGRLLRVPIVVPPFSDDAVLDNFRIGFYDGTQPIATHSLRELGVEVAPGDQYAKTILSEVVLTIPEGTGNVGFEVAGKGLVQMGVWRTDAPTRGLADL